MGIAKDIPERLRAERLRLRLTQTGMAELLGIPTVTLRSYESGRSEPPASFLLRLIRAGVNAHHVVLGESASDFLADRIDWRLLTEVAQLIGEWSKARPRPLELDEQARFLKLAYGWAYRHGRESAVAMLHELVRAA
jgi:transcriptional regulator with XRE-family HTH domain